MEAVPTIPGQQEQPIVLSYKDINNHGFIQALRGLVNHKWDAMTTAYKLTRVMDKVDSESKKAQEAWRKIIDTQIEWEGEGQERKPKSQEEYKKKEEEFLSMQFDLGKWKKFSVNDFLGYKFSAVELHALSPLMTGFDVLEEGNQDGDKKSH